MRHFNRVLPATVKDCLPEPPPATLPGIPKVVASGRGNYGYQKSYTWVS